MKGLIPETLGLILSAHVCTRVRTHTLSLSLSQAIILSSFLFKSALWGSLSVILKSNLVSLEALSTCHLSVQICLAGSITVSVCPSLRCLSV